MHNKILLGFIALTLLFCSCSNKKNTATSRWYHSVNTRYNIHFNADQAYHEALKSKISGKEEKFQEMLPIYHSIDTEETKKNLGGPFDVVIDKATKAIKLHSIQAKPERNPGKSRDAKYQEWLKQREFNPFLVNSWMIMAKAEYQNDDYLKSASTFSYVSRLYRTDQETVSEARLWTALCYTQMGWFYEADNIFYQIELAGGVPKKNQDLFSGIYANYLIRNQQYEKAVPYLQTAIKSESGLQKTRLKYLLAQVYGHLGEKEKAYKAFGNVSGMSTPYQYTFNSKIEQVNFSNEKERPKMISMLKRMTGNSKNKDYLDQVYLALGNIYLNSNDTILALKNYKLGVEKSTRNAYDKAMCQIQLGDIYFTQKNYTAAAPCYTEAVSQLTKKHEAYPRVSLRADVLGEVVVHTEAIHLQDSLQQLARLPKEEQLVVINKLIEDLKKQEELEKKLAEREANLEQGANAFGNKQITPPTMPGATTAGGSSFYFYNPQTVSHGKVVFQQRWGSRKLEDNWRRRDKTSGHTDGSVFAENSPTEETEQTVANDSTSGKPSQPEMALDKYSPEYYLQQLPSTQEAVDASNGIIEDAYFNLGGIYKDKLGDFALSIDAYTTDIKRFPSTPNLEEIYYQLFLIYSRMGNKPMADTYKNRLIAEFGNGNYAVTLSDPNYEWNLRNMGTLQNSLYEKAYEFYLAGNVQGVRNEVKAIKEKYPVSPLMPKFSFLNALTYAKTHESGKLKEELQFVVSNYPDSDVTPLAADILKNLEAGKQLAMGGGMARGMVWDVWFGDPMAEVDSLMAFSDNENDKFQLLLLYKPNSLDRNQLIYDIADYNFSNFTLKTFDLSFSQLGPFESLEIGGMSSYSEMKEYLEKTLSSKSLASKLDPNILFVPISRGNYEVMLRGRSLGDYFTFLESTYKKDSSIATSRWKAYVEKEKAHSKQLEAQQEAEKKPEEINIGNVETIVDNSEKIDTFKEAQERIERELEEKRANRTIDPTTVPEKVEIGVADAFTDEELEVADEVVNTATKILSNPVDGIKSLFEKNKNKPQLTKEEKAQLKKEKEEQKRLKKEVEAKQKAVQDSILNIEKEKERLIQEQAKTEKEAKKQLEQQKKDDAKAAAKAKEDARKQKEAERSAKEKARKEALKQKERERKEKLKQKEQERREKLKQTGRRERPGGRR